MAQITNPSPRPSPKSKEGSSVGQATLLRLSRDCSLPVYTGRAKVGLGVANGTTP